MERPKILIALFRMPYPITDGTRYKIFHNVIEGLVAAYDVEFLIATVDGVATGDVRHLEDHFGKVHLFRRSKLQFLFAAACAVFSRLPLQVAGWTNRAAKRWVRQHIELYDAVYIHEIRMTEHFIHLPESQRKKCLVDFNDAISYNYAMASLTMKFPKKNVYRIEGNRIKKYESNIMHAFSHFNVASPKDRTYLLNTAGLFLDTDFVSIPHGISIPTQQAPLNAGTALFFMGQLNYAPNRDALEYFCSTLWAPIKQAIPSASLHIIGKGKPPALIDPDIHFHGFVSDPYSVIERVAMLVAPVRYGAGVPSKILEAMAYGLPVVTTPFGTQGIVGIQPGEDIVTCDEKSIDEWVIAIKKVVEDESYRKKMGAQARSFIQKHYTSQVSQQDFRSLFARILRG